MGYLRNIRNKDGDEGGGKWKMCRRIVLEIGVSNPKGGKGVGKKEMHSG